MRLPDQHLSADELESLGKEGGLSGELGDQLRPAREHAESCPACRRRLEVYPTSGTKLEKLRAPQGAKKGTDCPSMEIWLQLAGGLLPSAEQGRYTKHAATCDHCGPVLREITKDFSDTVSEDEKSALLDLNRHNQKWMKSLLSPSVPATQTEASPVIVKPAGRHARRFGIPAWQGSAAALILVGVVVFSLFKMGVFTNKKDTIAEVNQLLAQAYTEQRTIELRIPGASYAPMRVKRSAEHSRLNQPAALLDAEALIKHRLEQQPDEPGWLDASGRAQLLDGDYEAAVNTLKRAVEFDPESTAFLTDLGTAYFERAEANGSASDYSAAIEELSSALKKNAVDTNALFNRAIAYERAFLYKEAIDDWNEYLKLEGSGGWAEEARRHLADLKLLLKERTSSSIQVPTDPATVLESASVADAKTWYGIDSKIDEYITVSLRWLTIAFPLSSSNTSASSRVAATTALHFVAKILEKNHADTWLNEMLLGEKSGKELAAVAQLSKAVAANLTDDLDKARVAARNAKKLFEQAGNRAGVARAELEEVHALQRGQNGYRCLSVARTLNRRIQGLSFRWIKIQALLEEASCQGKISKLDLAEDLANEALRLAQQNSFNDLALRAMFFTADAELSKGNLDLAWEHDQDGLGLCWHAGCSALRAYAFYDNLKYIAEVFRRWHLAVAAGTEAVREITETPNISGQAMARYRLAGSEKMIGENAKAEQEFATASSLFALQPTESNRIFHADSRLFLAELALLSGQINSAFNILLDLRKDVFSVSNYLLTLHFHRAMGAAYLAKLQFTDSEREAMQAVEVAEKALSSLHLQSEGLIWRNETSDAYRLFLRSYWEATHDGRGALEFWEWYRAAPLRMAGGRRSRSNSYWLSGPDGLIFGSGGILNVQWMQGMQRSQSKATFLSYSQQKDGLFVWVFQDANVEIHWIPISSRALEEHVQKLLALCADRDSRLDKLKAEARMVYSILIKPVEASIKETNLVIEPDGVVSQIPFEVLVDSQGHFVAETHTVSVSLGIAFSRSGQQPITPIENALIVAPVFSSGSSLQLPPLTDAAAEAKQVAGHFSHATLLIGSTATVEAVRKTLVHASVFHFAGHAFVSGRVTGLLLAHRQWGSSDYSNTLWGADEIYQMDLHRLKLAVLSSCTTDRDDRPFDSDANGVVSALLLSGVSYVVASRWNVDSKFTAGYMKDFYSFVLSSNSIPNSLMSAASIARLRVATEHPYYWAAFASFGRS